MTDAQLTTVLQAINVAVFTRRTDGSFSALAPPPPWFARLADVTFPFLGHILEEATDFWRSGASGSREYGPCAERDETGQEFHYRVRAVTAGESGSQFLIFELDPGSDRLREALQHARDQALLLERHRASQGAAEDIRLAAHEIQQLLKQLPAAGAHQALIDALHAKCDLVMRTADTIAG